MTRCLRLEALVPHLDPLVCLHLHALPSKLDFDHARLGHELLPDDDPLRLVTRVAARLVGADDAEDVAQETFLRAFHRLDQFRGEAPFRAWLLRIAHNVALNARARPQPIPVDDADEGIDDGDSTSQRTRRPADALELDERRRRLAAKLRLMQPNHRAVLVLRDLEGLTYEEIAVSTDAPIGSVKGRLFRARRELIELLRKNTYDWELPE